MALNISLNKTDEGLLIPFSATVYYDYLEAFLQGLDMDSYFNHASDCMDSLVYTVDDGYYVYNNMTLAGKNWSDVMINVSAMISGNFSSSVLNCF
jgi:hypothetical protein